MVSQLQAQVPHPLRDQLPALLPAGGETAPAIGVLFPILICQSRFKGATMQIPFDDIGSSKPLLRQIGEEEFVDHSRTRDANGALLFASWMSGHHHPARHTERSHWHFWTVVEAAHHLAFRALLELIGGQVQTRLDERMIKHGVLFATGHKGEASQVGQHGPGAILSIEPEEGEPLWELVRREVARDRREGLAQFRSVATVAPVAKRAEPTFNYGPG